MKLLVNTSTLSATGPTQVAVSFIEECRNFSEHTYEILLSESVKKNLNLQDFPENFHFYFIPKTPLMSPTSRRLCKKLERELQPDCVFSVFGPSYWTPKSPHLMGYQYPHYVYEDSPIYRIISLKERIRIRIYKHLHAFFLKRNGQAYVCETSDVSNRLQHYLKIPSSSIYTVGNTYNSNYFSKESVQPHQTGEGDVFKFLLLAFPHPHKNIGILNPVITLLKQKYPELKVRFILTMSDEALKRLFQPEVLDYIDNRGYTKIKDCPALYNESDALFLPTLLECYSANYAEAMAMKKPILTSDLPFAHVVCQEAALYFDPLNPESIVEKMVCVIRDNQLRQSLIEKGQIQLKKQPTSRERAAQYLQICQQLVASSNTH
jgi:glycosyltransferase involved in cell wall biosynthesis